MKKKVFFAANIVLPLLFGLIVYLTIKNGTYINSYLETNGKESDSVFLTFMSNWGCDALWSYSLTFAIYITLYTLKKRLHTSVCVSVLLGIFMEILQCIRIIPGTFDVFDIVSEVIAAVIAVTVIKLEGKKTAI